MKFVSFTSFRLILRNRIVDTFYSEIRTIILGGKLTCVIKKFQNQAILDVRIATLKYVKAKTLSSCVEVYIVYKYTRNEGTCVFNVYNFGFIML